MTTSAQMPDEMGNNASPNALSLYNQDGGMDDFPVLKAFQQYIDAEQAKARKRMVYLSIFFGVLMTILVVMFVLLLGMVQKRNQDLNDRLIEFAMKERTIPAADTSSIQKDATIKAMTEALTDIQKQLIEQQSAATRELAAVRNEIATRRETVVATPSQSQADVEREKANKEDARKLKKVKDALKAEKDRLAAEKERLRQQEIEIQRRRLYPEYYARIEAEKKAAKRARYLEELDDELESEAPSPVRRIDDEDLDDITPDKYFNDEPPAAPAKKPPVKKPAAKTTSSKSGFDY